MQEIQVVILVQSLQFAIKELHSTAIYTPLSKYPVAGKQLGEVKTLFDKGSHDVHTL